MKSIATIALAILFFSFQQPVKTSPINDSTSIKKGWKKLFDGKSTKGWHIYRGEGTGEFWRVEDGMLVFDPVMDKNSKVKKGGDLTTDEEYENYHFSVEWKISEGGNSGIIFGVKEDSSYKKSYLTGMEMQVLDNERHPDAKINKHRAGDLYDLIACNKETVKPAGEWNKAEVVYANNEIKLFLNGEMVVSTPVGDENWDKMIKGSKFKSMPGFGKFRKGRITLQDHGNKVWFRDIKIKEL
ncbi:MAG: DUF1080 domain-containing protein [Chitinophagaceae bacterium]|jgi:hypothetical protein